MIYADNAATTQISNSIVEKMLPFLHKQYVNASNQYSLGTRSKRTVERARKQVAHGRYKTIKEVEIIVKAICDAYDKITAHR